MLNDRPALARASRGFCNATSFHVARKSSRALNRAGVELLSKRLEISLVSAENSRPAEAFRARLDKRRVALGRMLETLPPDDVGCRAIDRLGQIALIEADEILVKQELRWPHLVSLDPESVPAHGIAEDNKLYLTPEDGGRYWPVVARSLLSILAPAAPSLGHWLPL